MKISKAAYEEIEDWFKDYDFKLSFNRRWVWANDILTFLRGMVDEKL